MATIESSIALREQEVLGTPPRLGVHHTPAYIQAAQEQVAKLRAASSGDSSPVKAADIPEMILSLMCHPELYECVAGLSIQLLGKGELSPRDRELVVLRVAWLCQAPYEWGEHVRMAKRYSLTSEDIEEVIVGSASSHWGDYDQALLKSAEELHRDAMIGDETWQVLSTHLNEKQLFELPVLVGQFTLVAYFQNALRFRLSEGNEGLKAR